MSAQLLQGVFESALATGAATLLVLALRVPVRHVLGARTAYALWWLVPVSLTAVMLPARPAALELRAVPVTAPRAVDSAASVAGVRDSIAPWLLGIWAFGAFAATATLATRQRRFRRALGPLQARADGSWRTDWPHASPAVIGTLRGRVVLPANFELRYTALQRELVLRHERVHIARFDLSANLFAAALRCLHWFNPLLHFAAARLRLDQELAADALVLAQRPDARRDYAEAMLSTQLFAHPPPLGCHWQPAHPLKERIMMLKKPLPGAWRTALGATLAAGLSLGAGYAAWAAQPARAGTLVAGGHSPALRITLSIEGKPVMVSESLVALGQRDAMVQASDGLGIDYEVTALDDSIAEIAAAITCAGTVQSRPIVRFRRGEHASVSASGLSDCSSQDARFDFFYATADRLREESRVPLGEARDVIDATYARFWAPAYPADAIAEKAEGTVLLRVLVDAQGKPAQIEVERSSGDARLDASARNRVAEWLFNPTKKDGIAQQAWVQVPVTFALHKDDAAAPKG